MKEPEFLFDDRWLIEEKELKEILDELKDPKVEKNLYVLETFARAAAYSFVDRKKIRLSNRLFPAPTEEQMREEIPSELGGEEIKQPKYYNETVNIQTGIDVYPVPMPSQEGRIQPALEFKEVPIYTKQIIKKRKKPEPLKRPEEIKLTIKPENIVTKNLITDNITNSVLCVANISDRYIVKEPELDSNDIDVLIKLKKKKIKNMEKGWELIKKYGKKYGIKEGHNTLIKYYVVNDFFGLGRIEPLLHDDDIKKIACDGDLKNIKVEVNGKELETNIAFLNKEEVFNFVYGLAEKIGVKIGKKNKTVAGTLRGWEIILNLGEDLQTPSFKAVRK